MILVRSLVASILLLLSLGSCQKKNPAGTEIEVLELKDGVTCSTVKFAGNDWKVITMDLEKAEPSIRFADALYLDGNVSRLYVPAISLTPKARRLGPVIGLWE